MKSVILEVRGLEEKIGSQQILRGIDFHVETGAIVTLLGPSGCGKTTTLRCIAGLIKPDKGVITVGGRTIFSSDERVDVPAEKRGLGVVFQSYALWPHMRVFQNVAFPLRVRKMPESKIKEKVRATLELVRLGGYEERYPFELSGGEQQRIAIARALVGEPEVVLLDEPLSNLDAKLREQLRFELRDLQRRIGTTFLYVTHDQAEAFALSDTIVLMELGKIAEVGPPETIYDNPSSKFAADFLGTANILEASIDKQTHAIHVNGLSINFSGREHQIESDKKAYISVRAEDIEIYPPNKTGINMFPAEITRASFTGMDRHYWVTLGEHVTLRVVKPKTLILTPKSKIIVHIPPDNIRILTR